MHKMCVNCVYTHMHLQPNVCVCACTYDSLSIDDTRHKISLMSSKFSSRFVAYGIAGF